MRNALPRGFLAVKMYGIDKLDPSRKPPPNVYGWVDEVLFSPPGLESAYCIFETQDEKNPTIERIADTLLPSIEAVGREWATFAGVSVGDGRVFTPVIVTFHSLLDPAHQAVTLELQFELKRVAVCFNRESRDSFVIHAIPNWKLVAPLGIHYTSQRVSLLA
jgi:hypothetical protein